MLDTPRCGIDEGVPFQVRSFSATNYEVLSDTMCSSTVAKLLKVWQVMCAFFTWQVKPQANLPHILGEIAYPSVAVTLEC